MTNQLTAPNMPDGLLPLRLIKLDARTQLILAADGRAVAQIDDAHAYRPEAAELMVAAANAAVPPKTRVERLEENRWLLLNSFGHGAGADGATREAVAEVEKQLMHFYEGEPVDPETVGQTGLAGLEGWGIFETSEGGLEIQADHESDKFCKDGGADDDAALAFVRKRAAAGSAYHLAALARVGQNVEG